MAGSYPNGSDNKRDLLRKIALNFYTYVVDFGGSGVNPPSWNDNAVDLEKKIAYTTAKAVDLHP